ARLAEILPREASLANPVDMLGSAVGSTYEEAIPHVLADPGIDAVIVLFVPPVVAGGEEVAAAAARGRRGGRAGGRPRGPRRACARETGPGGIHLRRWRPGFARRGRSTDRD